MTGPWQLFKQSIEDYRSNWRPIATIILIVAVPVALLSNYAVDPAGDTLAAAYMGFAQLAMNAALVYAIIRLTSKKPISPKQAYYQSSAVIIRLILTWVLLAAMSLSLLLGALILGYGVLVPGTALSVGEVVLLAVAAILVSIPSIILLIRGVWALYVIFETEKGPIEAVRQSRAKTKGKVVVTLGRLVVLALLLLAVVAAPVVLLQWLQSASGWGIFGAILEVLIALTVLPLAYFYTYRYWRELA